MDFTNGDEGKIIQRANRLYAAEDDLNQIWIGKGICYTKLPGNAALTTLYLLLMENQKMFIKSFDQEV